MSPCLQSPKTGSKKNKPPSKPPAPYPGVAPSANSSSAQSGGFYQPLQPVHSTYTADVYQQLNQGTRSNNDVAPPRPPTNTNPTNPRDPTYMGLSSQTRLQSEVYMGLEDARSWVVFVSLLHMVVFILHVNCRVLYSTYISWFSVCG